MNSYFHSQFVIQHCLINNKKLKTYQFCFSSSLFLLSALPWPVTSCPASRLSWSVSLCYGTSPAWTARENTSVRLYLHLYFLEGLVGYTVYLPPECLGPETVFSSPAPPLVSSSFLPFLSFSPSSVFAWFQTLGEMHWLLIDKHSFFTNYFNSALIHS